MSVSCPNITKLVDGLERDGLVRRGKLDGDRRVVLAELTPEGHALLERIVPELYAGAEAIMACLSSQECDEMIRLMLALRGGIQRSHHCRRADYTSGVRGAAPCRTDTASIDEQSGNSER
jgi:MarR family 2-MHQ and catechol resistance regulon transcriptional repressor